jgi:hypothetical protein
MRLCNPDLVRAARAGAGLLLLLLAARAAGGPLPVPAAPATNALTTAAERERALVEAWRQAADPQAMPVENMSLPIAHYPNGRVRAQLQAGRALIPANDSGYVRAKDVVIELYSEAGLLEGIVVAENCFFDRATSAGYSEGKVRLEQRGVHIRGANMVWNLETNSAKILSDPEVRFDRFLKGIGDLFK